MASFFNLFHSLIVTQLLSQHIGVVICRGAAITLHCRHLLTVTQSRQNCRGLNNRAEQRRLITCDIKRRTVELKQYSHVLLVKSVQLNKPIYRE